MTKDKRHPVLVKVGCYFAKGSGERGFVFSSEWKGAKDGDVFIYNQGILWRVRK